MLSLTALSLWRLIEDEKLFDTIEDAVSLKLGRGDHTTCCPKDAGTRVLITDRHVAGRYCFRRCLSIHQRGSAIPSSDQTQSPPRPPPDMPPGRNMEPDRNGHHTSRKNMGPERK